MKLKIILFLLLFTISFSFTQIYYNNIIIIAGGDVNLVTKVPEYYEKFNLKLNYYFEDIKIITKKGDIVFCNFEQVVSDEKQYLEPYPHKPYVFIGPASHLDILINAGFNVFSLANNHILDYGKEGLQRTIEVFNKRRALFFGAGMNDEDARKPLILNIKGKKIAFFGYIEKFYPDFHSRKNRGGAPAYMSYPENTNYHYKINNIVPETKFFFRDDFEKVKNIVDIIIVSIHFGHEYEHHPCDYQIKTAREAIDAGANIVLGHHPHVIQKIEKYKNGIIFYSLGNLVFPSFFVDPFVKLVEIEIDYNKKINSVKIHPFVIKNLRDPNLKINDYVLFKPVFAKGRWLEAFKQMLAERDIKVNYINNYFLLN